MVSVFGLPPLAPNRPLPRAIFDGICDVLCTSSTPQKRAGFLPRGAGGGSAPPARLPIAKAKATPHAMRSNMPGIRCLVYRRIEGLPPMPPTPSFPTLQKGCARQTSMYLIAFVVFAFICHISNWCRALSINSISTTLWSASTSIEGRRCSDPLWLWWVKGCQG